MTYLGRYVASDVMGIPESSSQSEQIIAGRPAWPLGMVIAVGCVFLFIWTANAGGQVDAQGFSTWPLTGFVWLFVFPIAVWTFVALKERRPFVTLDASSLNFRPQWAPWKLRELSCDDVLELQTDWLPDTSWCMIKLRLSEQAYMDSAGDWTWNKREGGWVYFDLCNSDKDPDEVASAISKATGIPYTKFRL